MSYQTAVSGLDWKMVPSGMSIPSTGISVMQLYEQGMGAIIAGNNVGSIQAVLTGGDYVGTINDIVYDTITIAGFINANRTVQLYYNNATQDGQKRYMVVCSAIVASGGPYSITLTTGSGNSFVIPVAVSGYKPTLNTVYVDNSGNVVSDLSIINSGSNSNGSFVQFADGTMEQWGSFVPLVGQNARSFPVNFVRYDSIQCSYVPSAGYDPNHCIWINNGAAYSYAAAVLNNFWTWHAIGTWK